MEQRVIDVRGKPCPLPVIETKKGLEKQSGTEPVVIVLDNETSKNNVERFLHNNGFRFVSSETSGEYRITIGETQSEIPRANESHALPPDENESAPVICITGKTMGSGAAELGEILIRAFINTIPEISPCPSHIVFYNSGIFFALDDSPVLQTLNELEKSGVQILVCGTCTKYFDKTDNVAAGAVSNMYDIMDTLFRASRVITP
jgi:selenium metabolism protein YedF